MPYKNRESLLAQRRRYYRSHRQVALDKMKRYYEGNLDKIKAYQRKYREAHREELKQYEVEYRKTHPDKRKRGDYNYFLKLRKLRGLNRKQYNDILSSQNGVCAICRQISASKLHLDHNHATGAVRGLLCSRCNTGLGMIERVGVGAIITYLEKSDTDRQQELLSKKN